MTAPIKSDMSVTIIDFEDQYAEDFARLNYEWLESYFKIEPHDREILDAPLDYVIKRGGRIFFAKIDNKVVGTAALIVEDKDTYELAKMGVTPEFKGLKIGRKLINHAINEARKEGKASLVLESNTKLTPAINLYISTGFKAVPQKCSPYARCNIRMELKL